MVKELDVFNPGSLANSSWEFLVIIHYAIWRQHSYFQWCFLLQGICILFLSLSSEKKINKDEREPGMFDPRK
jgi:hypothetical protein